MPKFPGRPPKNDPQDKTVEVTRGLATGGGWPAEQPSVKATASATAHTPRTAGSDLLLVPRGAAFTFPSLDAGPASRYPP